MEETQSSWDHSDLNQNSHMNILSFIHLCFSWLINRLLSETMRMEEDGSFVLLITTSNNLAIVMLLWFVE